MSSERQQLDKNDPWWGEHMHRYMEVCKLLQGNESILDLACGTGFGTDTLAGHTSGVVTGGDVSLEAIEDCKRTWKKSNCKFQVLDGTNLTFADNTFDVVVSFETIEHTKEYVKMCYEFARVCKPTGYIIISTPNFIINSPTGVVTNPYHTQEFTFKELKNLLSRVFQTARICGQKCCRYEIIDSPGLHKIINSFFSIRGIRKYIPYTIKTGISKYLTGVPFYPEIKDFQMVESEEEVMQCKTFYCICRK
jgi:2-polyprenyl-3-methyl-5-hydroxy-6-metoxy-1,4-benzoquinol methylase